MKKIFILFFILISSVSFAQFKTDANKPVNVNGGITNNSPSSLILGFFNPDNFRMKHSFEMSYSAFGRNGLALGVYTNSMYYKFNDELNIQVDASVVNSPYNTLGNKFTNDLNGLYLSKAQLNYRPSDKFSMTIEYQNLPTGTGYFGYGSPFFGNGFFNSNPFRENPFGK